MQKNTGFQKYTNDWSAKLILPSFIITLVIFNLCLLGMGWARRRQSPTFSATPLAPRGVISGGQKGSEWWATMRSPSSCSRYGNPEKAWQGGSKSRREARWRRRHPKTKTPLLLVQGLTIASGGFRDGSLHSVPHPYSGCLHVLELKFLPFNKALSVLNPVLEFSQ